MHWLPARWPWYVKWWFEGPFSIRGWRPQLCPPTAHTLLNMGKQRPSECPQRAGMKTAIRTHLGNRKCAFQLLQGRLNEASPRGSLIYWIKGGGTVIRCPLVISSARPHCLRPARTMTFHTGWWSAALTTFEHTRGVKSLRPCGLSTCLSPSCPRVRGVAPSYRNSAPSPPKARPHLPQSQGHERQSCWPHTPESIRWVTG